MTTSSFQRETMNNQPNRGVFGAFQTIEDAFRYTDYFIAREWSDDSQVVTEEFFAAHIELTNAQIIRLFNLTHPAQPRPLPERALKSDIAYALEKLEDALKDIL